MADVSLAFLMHKDALRQRLYEWMETSAVSDEAHAADPLPDALLDALCGAPADTYLPRFEAIGRALAEQDGRLETCLATLQQERAALAQALNDLFADDHETLSQAHEALGALSGQTAITLAHGYQSVKTYQKAFDAELARRGATRLRALGRINAVANSASDIDLTLTTAADAIAEEMDADLCAIFLFDEATRELQLRATNGLLPSNGSHYTRALGQGYSGWVAEHGEPIMVADALADSRFSDEASAYPIELHGLISAPIIFFTSDTLEGALSVQTRAPRAFTQDEVTFLEIAAGQIAMSIENGRLLATNDLEFRRKLQELNTLYRASALVASSLKRDNVLRMIVEQAVVLCNAERSVVFELERIEGNQPNARNQPPMQLRVVASHGFAEFADDELPQLFLPVGECCLALAAREGQPMMRVDCMRRESGCYFFGRSAAIDNQHVVVAAPLNTVHGSLGLLCVLGGQRHVLSDQQRQLMLTFANVAAIAIENARLYEAASEGLRTKEILLREMHHRVKNNLQQVKSILNLTRNRVHSPEMEQVLGESMDRIQGIAAAHELLSTGRLGMAPIEEISRRIVAISRTNAAAPTLRLRFRIGRAPYYLPTDQTTTLAIVLNELVANAIEHGFEGRTSGEISINVAHEDERIVVQVADNGAGLPPGFSVTRAGGLGLELVNRLVSSDLRGSFQMYETTQDPGAGGERVTDPALPVVTAGDESEPQRWTVAEIAFPASLLATPPAEFVG